MGIAVFLAAVWNRVDAIGHFQSFNQRGGMGRGGDGGAFVPYNKQYKQKFKIFNNLVDFLQ